MSECDGKARQGFKYYLREEKEPWGDRALEREREKGPWSSTQHYKTKILSPEI